MKRTVYRGISLREAESVISNQVYERNERRDFQSGIRARSTFGPGIYLINDVELAAHYAFCHTEVEEEERAAVLKQKISLQRPYILNHRSTEEKLRRKALEWKTEYGDIQELEQHGIGQIVKEYLLHNEYDGIVYHIDDEIIYYVGYYQDHQVEEIEIDFIFRIHDLKNKSVHALRDRYKREVEV